MELTFDQLPKAVSRLLEKIDTIERHIVSQSNNPQPEGDKLLNIKQAAEILHLSVPTVYGLVQRAQVPVCKRGKRLYFSRLELTSWIMAGRKKTTSEIEAEVGKFYINQGKKGRL